MRLPYNVSIIYKSLRGSQVYQISVLKLTIQTSRVEVSLKLNIQFLLFGTVGERHEFFKNRPILLLIPS